MGDKVYSCVAKFIVCRCVVNEMVTTHARLASVGIMLTGQEQIMFS